MTLIDKPIFHSRIKSENITGKEKWLGYLIELHQIVRTVQKQPKW